METSIMGLDRLQGLGFRARILSSRVPSQKKARILE